MLGRLFGKNKDTDDKAVCAECGRTLLAGEWTQTIEDDDGHERLLCSLCGQAHPVADGERLRVGSGGAGAARVSAQGDGETNGDAARLEPARDENAALWKAIKDRDAQIESLREELARGEAERQELVGRLARPRAAADAPADEAAPAAPVPAGGTADDEPAVDVADDEPVAEPAAEAQADLLTLAEEPVEAPTDEAEPVVAATDGPDVTPAHVSAEDTAEIDAADAPAAEPAMDAAPADAEAQAAEAEAQDDAEAAAGAQAASMTLLQRGVDLLNVSPVPRKIAETNADLGIPTVHVGFDGQTATVTFMWSMGWYRFTVDVDGGSVSLGDRGYEERVDLQPNASVRADGTVQLAAAMISRAAAQRQQSAPAEAAPAEAAAAPAQPPAEKAETEAAPPAGGPEILSKSLLGQRTDDERPSWERTQARDFDWDH